MTAISYHDTVNDLHGLDLSGKGPFARLEWFALLEQAGHQPMFASVRTAKSVMCLALQLGKDALEPLTNWYAFTWEPMSAGAEEPTLAQALAASLAKQTDRLVLAKIPDENGCASMLENTFNAAGWITMREACDTNHVLRVQGRSYADYIAGRPGPLRTTLKRKARKVEVRLSRTFDNADWAAYEDIYRHSWKPEEGDPALLRAFACGESAAGRLLFGMALADGKPVAAQFWTVDHGTAYIHKLAHLESAQPLSPGTTLTAALFAEVIDRDRVVLVDFGTGNDGYKADWMEETRPRYRLTCLRPGSPRNWPLLAKSSIAKLVSGSSAG